MADGENGGNEGGTIPPGVFYSARRSLRPGRPRLEDPDIMFAALGNGDISDADDEEDETDEASAVVDVADDDWANPQELSDSSDEDDQHETRARDHEPWCRKVFEKPCTQFQPVSDENDGYLGPPLTPYEYFSRYVSKSVFTELADKTNMYSICHDGKSVPTDEEEIRRLIALHLAMGVIRYPRLRLYWKPSFKTELLSSVSMSRNRFEKLRSCLHIVDVNGDHNANDRLWKVRPLLNSFQERFRQLPLEEHLCVDEQIIPFKGKLDVKQYVKGKPNPWGVKVFTLCGASGVVYDFIVYQGSTTELSSENKQTFGVTGAFVLHLAARIPDGIGHKLFFDNYFTSLPVLRVLLEKRIYAAGTIQKSRTEKCPLKTEKQLKKEGRGSSDYLVSSDGKIVITRWMDNRAVNLASNCVGVDDEDVVNRWSKADGDYISVKRPAVVKKYNESMGGVDKTDFLVSLYRTSIRSRKWTLRVIVHFFHLCVTNSWLEYRHHAQLRGISTKEQMDLLEFTLAVVESLAKACSLNLPRKRGRPSTSPLQPLKRPNATTLRPVHDVRYDQIGHWPFVEREQQRCKLEGCTGKPKIKCQKCNVHLCLSSGKNCFLAFHTR